MAAMTELTTIADRLVAERLEAVLQSKFDAKEFRLSESGACPRKRVARVLGLPADENSVEDAEYFERGNVNEAWIVDLFREAFPRRCRTQVPVRTPFGDTGHIDLWFPAERRIIEIKSVSLGARELPRREHVMQVQAYLHFFRDSQGNRKAMGAELVYVRWGAGLKVEAYPIVYDPEIGAAIETELARLHSLADAGTLPDKDPNYKPERYPCAWRNRAGEVRCPYWELCWAAEDTAPALDAPEVADDAERYAELDAKLRAIKQTEQDLEQAIDLIRQRMSAVLNAHNVDTLQAGRYVIKRTLVAGRTTYDIAAAIQARVVDPEALRPFAKVSSGYARWTIKEAR